MSIKRQVKQREPIPVASICKELRQREANVLREMQTLRDYMDSYHIPATVVPNMVSAARSLKVSLEHIRAALSIAEDLE